MKKAIQFGAGNIGRGFIGSLLSQSGMQHIQAVLSDDIEAPVNVTTLSVSPEKEYDLGPQQKLTAFRSTDLGVAFLVEDRQELIYHAGDLNDWVWEEETQDYNTQMTDSYRKQIDLLAQKLNGRQLELAFVVLDPRQEADYARGLCYFLEHIPAGKVYPMHYWGKPEIIATFLRDHPAYSPRIEKTEIL